MAVRFYVGVHQPRLARHFDRCMVSVNTLRGRVSDFPVNEWMLDSGAFTQVTTHGRYPTPLPAYAAEIARWSRCGTMVAAVSRDWMCEPIALAATGMTIAEHQRWTVYHYRALRRLVAGVPILPVLQGFAPADYAACVGLYGDDLAPGTWVGVGSVCKRQGDPAAIVAVLEAINGAMPGLRLHGFGIKATALAHPRVRALLWSADSMAWSYRARKQGRDANSWHEAERFRQEVEAVAAGPRQRGLFDGEARPDGSVRPIERRRKGER